MSELQIIVDCMDRQREKIKELTAKIDELNNADRHDLRDATRQRKQLAEALVMASKNLIVDDEWPQSFRDANAMAYEIIAAKGGA